jgi:hypothetical protein
MRFLGCFLIKMLYVIGGLWFMGEDFRGIPQGLKPPPSWVIL